MVDYEAGIRGVRRHLSAHLWLQVSSDRSAPMPLVPDINSLELIRQSILDISSQPERHLDSNRKPSSRVTRQAAACST